MLDKFEDYSDWFQEINDLCETAIDKLKQFITNADFKGVLNKL